jgi:hypothetical protein
METMETVLTKEQKAVKKIHSAFDKAADTHFAMATRAWNDNGNALKVALEKAALARELGFSNCEAVKSATQIALNLEKYKLVISYKEKYPFLKFITEKQLNGLCKKYNLVHAPVGNYTGKIPLQKLIEIAEGKKQVMESDLPPDTYTYKIDGGHEYMELPFEEAMSESDLRTIAKNSGLKHYFYAIIKESVTRHSELRIAAPVSQFKGLNGLTKKGFAYVKKVFVKSYPDPIVLQPVKDGYLVLAKWGPEADDEELVVPELN